MKNLIFGGLASLLIGFVSCNTDTKSDQISPSLVQNPATASAEKIEAKWAAMEFSTTEQDFGSIVEGETVKMVYNFTNTGEIDLIISAASGSCGCTVPTWPKRPIKPGQQQKIEVVFNSSGKKGIQKKKIYITANTDPTTNVLLLKGEVVAPN